VSCSFPQLLPGKKQERFLSSFLLRSYFLLLEEAHVAETDIRPVQEPIVFVQVEPGTCLQKLVGSVRTGVILKDVSLEVHGGELTAILGSKGWLVGCWWWS
jgi:hypothetical protein